MGPGELPVAFPITWAMGYFVVVVVVVVVVGGGSLAPVEPHFFVMVKCIPPQHLPLCVDLHSGAAKLEALLGPENKICPGIDRNWPYPG